MTARILVDECVNRRVVLPPFAAIADCVFVAKQGKSAPDEDVLAMARREGLILLTEDSDFGRLVFAELRPPPPGIILVTMPNLTPAERSQRVLAEAAAALADAPGALVVIDSQRRRRRPFQAE